MTSTTTAGVGGGGGSLGGSKGGRGFHSPPVELPSSNAQNFFEEAKVKDSDENELRRKFGKFCTRLPPADDGGVEELFLTLENLCRMLQYYDVAPAQHYEAYFHAMDRNSDDRLDFEEFFLGCCAADPTTVHILNSFTGYERSQYIFDFYDTNRSATLEFDEFARLTADCLSMQDASEELVRSTALEKAQELGAMLEGPNGEASFSCIKFKTFYEFVQNERLRGTSRLFRFHKSIIKRGHHGRRAQGSSASNSSAPLPGANLGHGPGGSGLPDDNLVASASTAAAREAAALASAEAESAPSDNENCSWHAQLLDLDAYLDPGGRDPFLAAPANRDPIRQLPPRYTSLTPPAPPPQVGARVEADAASATDARAFARKVVRTLSSHHFEGLLPSSTSAVATDTTSTPFALATPVQLRALCVAAVRLLEPEDMVLTGLQTPVKIFGSIHGQLSDLLSHFKWHQLPVEDDGDILYTTYVFLGDYADRGSYGLEVLTLLLSLKVAHPHRVFLLRGNHENRHVNFHMGLRAECERRLGPAEGMRTYESLNRVFEHMSLAAIVGQQVLAFGPGILPVNLTRLDQLRRYRKPLVLPHASQPRPSQPLERLDEQILLEMFTPNSLLPRELGAREATPEQIKVFCSQHRLGVIVRSRLVPPKGFSIDCEGHLITITSCLDYCDAPGGNDAAILCVTKEEGAEPIHMRPKVLTAQVGKAYHFVGRVMTNFVGASLKLPRWPAQLRDMTPGRSDAFGKPVTESDSAIAGVVLNQDRSISFVFVGDNGPSGIASLNLFPAFGTGRPPGGMVPQDRSSINSSAVGYGNHPSNVDASAMILRGRTPAQQAGEDVFGPLGNCTASGGQGGSIRSASSGGSTLSERRSIGTRRGAVGGGQDQKRGSSMAAGDTPQRRGSSTVVDTPPRLSIGRAPLNISPTAAAGASVASSPGGTGERRDKVVATGGSTPTGGRTPANGGVVPVSGQPGRRAGVGGTVSAKPPKEASTTPSSSVGGPRALRRPGSEMNTVGGHGAPPSPRGRRTQDGFRFEESTSPSDIQSLDRLQLDASQIRLTPAILTSPSPSVVVQSAGARGGSSAQQQFLFYLCRLWIDAGLGDREWAQALSMYDSELGDQPRQVPQRSQSGIETVDSAECRWTLETFSMWFLKRGRRLRECSHWFHAFDYDHDEMVCPTDFLQGLVAATVPPTLLNSNPIGQSSSAHLVRAALLYRLVESVKSNDIKELEAFLRENSSPSCSSAEAAELAKGCEDFESFQSLVLPRMQDHALTRLRVF